MILINFSHPLSGEARAQIEALTGQAIAREIEVPTELDLGRPFGEQVVALADAAGLSAREWQTVPILIVPPGLSACAAALLAELHGRTGYFVPVVRTRPVADGFLTRFEVAEIVDLRALRDAARTRRGG